MLNPTRLQQAREIRGWTQTALAQQVGVHQSAIAQLETGRMQPSPEVLVLQRQLSCRPQETTLIMVIPGVGLMLTTPVRPREHM
jgi:transcriptional regulator with XRE-family HTH domain